MLISHHHRFVFVKPRKTAGTTAELALSPFLAPGDLATPIEAAEEGLRRTVPGVLVGPIRGRGRFGLPVRLRDHSPLARAEALLGPAIAGYRVVTMCRNPWDRAVSQFFWTMRHGDMRSRPFAEKAEAFRAYTRRWGPAGWLDRVYGRKRQRALDATPLYFVGGVCRAGYAVRFEHLAEDLAGLQAYLGLPGAPDPAPYAAKAGLRAGGRDWRPFYDAATRDLVARECAREIALFGYDFEGSVAPRGRVIASPGSPAASSQSRNA